MDDSTSDYVIHVRAETRRMLAEKAGQRRIPKKFLLPEGQRCIRVPVNMEQCSAHYLLNEATDEELLDSLGGINKELMLEVKGWEHGRLYI